MEAETATLLGKYVGALTAILLVPFVAAIVSRQFVNRTVGVLCGTFAGASVYLLPMALIAAAAPAHAGDKDVYSWKTTFAEGYAFFQEVKEHPSQVRTVSTAQYAMLVKSPEHEFRICRLHYSDDGKTPVGICEDIAGLEDLAKETN